jgi:hypothetical protein
MNQDWPTRDKDLIAARNIMEEYAYEQNSDALGLFEIVVNPTQKRMNFRLSGWVFLLAKHFSTLYGMSQGEFITRQVLSCCITQGETLH